MNTAMVPAPSSAKFVIRSEWRRGSVFHFDHFVQISREQSNQRTSRICEYNVHKWAQKRPPTGPLLAETCIAFVHFTSAALESIRAQLYNTSTRKIVLTGSASSGWFGILKFARMSILSAELFDKADSYRKQFDTAKPFRHVLITPFFEPAIAEAMLTEFPGPLESQMRNEFGRKNRKFAFHDVRSIGRHIS